MGTRLDPNHAGPATLRPRLLVVDDQPVNIHVVHQAFAADHQVFMATSGEQALQLCRTHLPDIILLDVLMPVMDGHEVCRQLKADPSTRDIPVIFVTAQGDAEQETLGLALGAVDFIVKPINAEVVRARVRSHLALARSNALLAATLEATSEGVLVTHACGGISSMNQNFVRMWNLPADVAAGADHGKVFDFMRRQVLHGSLCDGNPAAVEGLDDPQGGLEPLELTGDRHFERQGKPLKVNASLSGVVWSFRDVTERWRATKQLQLLNDTLESRIQERTRALQLAVHQADAASRAKSAFLSNMSHEIRTPLNGVIGLANMALRAKPEPRQRDFLQKIHDSGLHLLGIINDVLDFSKIEAGKLELDVQDLDLAGLFDGLSGQTMLAAQGKGLGLRFEIEPALRRPMRGDPLRVTQILLNYLGNAIKFTSSGEVVVRATCLQHSEAECVVRFEVQDSGIGMTEAQVAQLFQAFHQGDNSTTRQYGGSGLGLAISKQLAQLMGGEVGVQSQPGRGSTFWLTVTFAWAAPASAVAPTRQPRPAPWEALRGRRVLVAEDNLINREIAVGLLEDVGATVRSAENGAEAVALALREPFDCVLMDLHMPVMDGLQATRQLRAHAQTAGLRVIAMTANALSEARASCLEAGMDDFLTKPVAAATLYATLTRWITTPDGSRAPADARAPDPQGSPALVATASTAALAPADVPPPGDPDIVDLSVLAGSVGGIPERWRRYAALFAESLPEVRVELESALARGDLPALAAVGHRLKSSARWVGATGLAEQCQALEDLRSADDPSPTRPLIEAILLKLDRIAADITRALA